MAAFEVGLVVWVLLSIPSSLVLGPALAAVCTPAEAPVATEPRE